MLGEATIPLLASRSGERDGTRWNIRELLARLQIGHLDAKHRALDTLVHLMKEDDKNVLAVLGRTNVSALVHLLTATSLKIKEKAVSVICSLAESGSCEHLLVSEGVLPLLIRLVESGSSIGKANASISLQWLSMTADTARSIVGHGGVRPLIEICHMGESVSQAAAAGCLKNLSAVPEVRQVLAEDGIVKAMISLLDCGILLGSKEYAAECLQHLTSSNDNLRQAVVSDGGLWSLLAYLDGPQRQESAVGSLRNLVGSVSVEGLIALNVLPRIDMKKMVGEIGCISLLMKMLEAKTNNAREVAAQAICSLLLIVPQNCREIRKNEKSVPSLVQLLDPNPQNSAKKYAISCLGYLSSSKKCKKLMVSYGAVGYLKKLTEMEFRVQRSC